MPTLVELCLVILLLVSSTVVKIHGKPRQIKSGCRYESKRYQEGAIVTTVEPCLQCRCVEGSLRCRLRVCPRLPQPAPPGCRARPPAENVCCPELICGTEEDENESILQRSNTDIFEHSKIEQGCLYEGVRYGPGSAMMGSRRCEYCYCISSVRRCIRPKCLLPLPGCMPLYAPHSCCPVAYNCSRHVQFSTTPASISENGCRTEQRVYQEGEMVRDIAWKADCDNCFCAMGAIRCVPLACAPPLQGCKPIVREGQCCPSTYNCSGTIEVKAAQNYASYAFISKDYAKFRKETNFYPAFDDIGIANIEGRGHRVVNEPLDFDTGTQEIVTEKYEITTESFLTLETETINNEILRKMIDYPKLTTYDHEQLTTTSTEFSTSTNMVISDESVRTTRDSIAKVPIETTTLFASYLEEGSTTLDDSWTGTLSTTMSEGVFSMNEDPAATTSVTMITEAPESTSLIATTIVSADNRTTKGQEIQNLSREKSGLETTSFINLDKTTTMKTENTNKSIFPVKKIEKVKKSGSEQTTKTIISVEEHKKVIIENEKAENVPVISVKKPSAGISTSIIMPDDILVMNVTVKTNVAVGHIHGVTLNPVGKPIPPDIEAILNITNRGKEEDYEYDYSNPTLPPSLPNVRIIPFVAADALVKDEDDNVAALAVTGYPLSAVVMPPELKSADTNFYDIITQKNRFQPPEETEGGFIPREPPYFNPLFHSSNINLEIGTGVTVVPEIVQVSNPHRKNDELFENCLYEEQEYDHGQILPSRVNCIICMCYYGEIMCSSQKCPPLKIGCQRIDNTNDKCCSKVICVGGAESPTVVLNQIDSNSSSQYEPTISSDPFRNVIKTEPAPDLSSLIGDMMIPYLVGYDVTTAGSIANDGVKSPSDADRKLVSQRKPSNFSSDSVSLTSPNIVSDIVGDEPNEQDSIFSLDSVLDLFFNEPTSEDVNSNKTIAQTSSTSERLIELAATTGSSKESLSSLTSTATTIVTTSTTATTPTETSIVTSSPKRNLMSTKPLEKDSTTRTSGSLLKLAGCNIYGRMYRVGRIIMELSNPCLECRCTDVGVQCKTLDC